MKFITYAETTSQLETLNKQVIDNKISKNDLEVIVGVNALSRYSEASLVDLEKMIALNQQFELPLVLEWDTLSQESLFQKSVELLSRLPLHEFKAIRVQDPGALNIVKEKYPWLKIQLILENGNHNFAGLSRWSEFLGEQLDRLVLSNELSRDHLRYYASELKSGLEVLAFGRILLFYSPRLLLSPLKKEEIEKSLNNKNIEASGSSEESPHTGFPLIENRHGTFMFNVKDLYLLDHLEELKSLNIAAVRFDLRFDESFKHLEKIANLYAGRVNHDEILEIKSNHSRPMIKGFYNINKTDVLFTKLKNKRIQRQDDKYVGEIVDVERDQQMALVVKSKTLSLKIGDEITLVTPEGKTKILGVKTLLDSSKKELTSASVNEIVLLPFISGVVAKTQVYLAD
ncbi:MAG: U32 family peptidase [Bdellovibrionales bacterium]|nr:U32 family peptidase [Bdellovibrionales bacterium]